MRLRWPKTHVGFLGYHWTGHQAQRVTAEGACHDIDVISRGVYINPDLQILSAHLVLSCITSSYLYEFASHQWREQS